MTKKWFRICTTAIFILSLILRFWGLGRFNTLVFDEVYFAQFGNNYLTNTPFFNAHPPLSQYIIGLGIWIGNHIPFWQNPVNGATGSLLSPWSYRWANAFTGSLIPLIVIFLTYQLSYRRGFALLTGLFTALDGLFLVESRYALSNIYIVIFGLIGHWFLLLALEKQNKQRWFALFIAGISFGASIGTKWNGLWFLAGAYGIWIAAWIIRWLQSFSSSPRSPLFTYLRPFLSPSQERIKTQENTPQIPLQKITQINILQMGFFLGIIPILMYSLIWIPHLQLDTSYGFIEVHKQILQFHLQLGGNDSSVHPYCAAWYKWPLMTRPMAYYYQITQSFQDPIPVFGPPLPPGAGKVVYDVHAMGNPFLWWFGLATIIFLVGMLFVKILLPGIQQKRLFIPKNLGVDTWIALYIVINYAANLLPWVKVNRCVFIYHYMSAVIFTFIALAWFVDQCLRSYYRGMRILGLTISFTIIVAFVFWLPIYLGLPLSVEDYHLRMWFRSWI
ncbi:phospholipid carrier-dependent glycosyltransferase [Sphaerospermopsis kisseleviana CS-549]|uniref:Polyprenol-phosphate-mannose--protein mannosyltransferase n=1 Tax=Sphaerospermopsis kisseleviana CS-549 TaxID=3021783 RepID=A0ABT4ZVT8_9CYAN|nr:phospholipid carrier-dependent glycosyltransferase [Sphaerospermopsis kisseleviana]MDB9443139.1 phospholipid carrier-dependent glycosyltransferase [Sphaerospermopsis kisseleviana CS-549]BAZ80811.1 family 39 glycosyl transferase [Sphaerospermopsis kisseleviana NIES-73]